MNRADTPELRTQLWTDALRKSFGLIDWAYLSDALFDACCAMKAEERMGEEWENDSVSRCNYDMRRS